jgi:hypothetical protein
MGSEGTNTAPVRDGTKRGNRTVVSIPVMEVGSALRESTRFLDE